MQLTQSKAMLLGKQKNNSIRMFKNQVQRPLGYPGCDPFNDQVNESILSFSRHTGYP